MAVESSFNPFAQSTVGAQGLMQVMTQVHDDKYEAFGGTRAAFDPITNLRVGAQVLKECIERAGGLQEGLRFYVGAALLSSDGGYADKVLAEQAHMRNVADGRAVPHTASNTPSAEPRRRYRGDHPARARRDAARQRCFSPQRQQRRASGPAALKTRPRSYTSTLRDWR
jgi:soluble lytic murein transglycosylase-like protein